MTVVVRGVAGLLLIAHGLVHLLYLTADTPEFSLDRSWIVPKAARHLTAIVLMVAVVFAFVLVGLIAWNVPGFTAVWPAVVGGASVLSIILLVAFWNWSLVFGIAIDVVLIAIAVAQPGWSDIVGG